MKEANQKDDRCSKIHRALNTAINQLLALHGKKEGTLLDVGCWDGVTTQSYMRTLSPSKTYGIEIVAEQVKLAEEKGIHVLQANIETERWDIPDASIDTVVCNQVFEHLKNIYVPFDEIARALRPGGMLVISVPNLASFHNRVMLSFGLQPSSIRIWGPHVRAYALRAFTSFCTTSNSFEVVEIRGVGFYPFPPDLGGNLLANIWKGAAHTPVWVLRRTPSEHVSFQKTYAQSAYQTTV